MIRSRSIRITLLLLFAALLTAATLVYQNRQVILQYQINQILYYYGVQHFEWEKPRFSQRGLQIVRLLLRGHYQNFHYDISIGSIDIRYDWQSLLLRKVQSVTVSSLDANVKQVLAAQRLEGRSIAGEINLGQLLPQRVISELPTHSLYINQWTLHFLAHDNRAYSAAGQFGYQDNIELHAKTAIAERDVTAYIKTEEDAVSIDIDVNTSASREANAELAVHIETDAGSAMTWQVQGTLQHQALHGWLQQLQHEFPAIFPDTKIAGFNLHGNSDFTGEIKHPETLQIPQQINLQTVKNFEATVSFSSDLERLSLPDKLIGLNGKINAVAALKNQKLHIEFAPFELSGSLNSDLLPLSATMYQRLQWQNTVPFHWSNSSTLTSTYDGKQWESQSEDSQLQLGNSASRLRLDRVQFENTFVTEEPQAVDTQLHAFAGTRLHNRENPVIELDLKQHGPVTNSVYALQLTDAQDSFSVQIDGKANLRNGDGSHQLYAKLSDLGYISDTVGRTLRGVNLLPEGIALQNGSIELQSTLNTRGTNAQHWQQKSRLTVKNVSGVFDEYPFDALTLTAHWTGLQFWKTIEPVQLSISKIAVGFDIQDIKAVISLPEATDITQPAMQIETFSAQMFGGRLQLPNQVRWDFSAPSNTLTFEVQKWQLAELVALQQAEDISAKGILDGGLPLTVEQGVLSVEAGHLSARPPGGFIKYRADESSRSVSQRSKELDLALSLLSDFEYNVLDSTVRLDDAGNLQLGLSLAGHNPTQLEGRPVNFNINLQQNIHPLLQTLRLSDNLVRGIENRLQ